MLARSFTLSLLPILVFATACGGDEPTDLLPSPDAGTSPTADAGTGTGDAGTIPPPPDQTAPVFAPDHLIEVDITVDEADWEVLRNQARTFADLFGDSMCVDTPPTKPYTYFPATVTIDGETFDQVGVRKKGFFGSVNPIKPSLKLKFDEYVIDQEFSGFQRMTFNNARQGNEGSIIHQCLAYRLFGAAGIASPRCNHARVNVNGDPYSVYVHVESVKKRFIRRHFDDDEGALYEGALSDFRPVYIGTFERKTNREIMDRSDLDAIAAALTLDDDELLGTLADLIDIDEFITFWAMEIIIQHWDGYTSFFNNNNFYIYRNPDTGRFHFIPWGVDAIMGHGPQDLPQEVFLASLLSRRLYEHPDTEGQLYVRMSELLTNVWDEIELLTYIRETEQLVRPHVHPEELDRFNESLAKLRSFVQRRRGELEALLAGPKPTIDEPIRPPLCITPIGELSGTFDAEWGTFPTNNPFGFGTGTFTATVGPNVFTGGANNGAIAGVNEDGTAVVQVTVQFPDDSLGALIMYMPPEDVVAGATVPLDVNSPRGAVLYYVPAPGEPAQLVGSVGAGEMTFIAADTMSGAPVLGTFRGQLFEQ